jgi:hypothetical protein
MSTFAGAELRPAASRGRRETETRIATCFCFIFNLHVGQRLNVCIIQQHIFLVAVLRGKL